MTGFDHLYFEPIDIHLWKVDEGLYTGRPGEEKFRLPQEVINVLNDIKSAKRSPYYQVQEDGRFYIFIPSQNIRGIASWNYFNKNTF